MASFSELANLSADVVAKVEDSKEARPALRPRFRSQYMEYARHTGIIYAQSMATCVVWVSAV